MLGAAAAALGRGISRTKFLTYLPSLYVAGVLRDRRRAGADVGAAASSDGGGGGGVSPSPAWPAE
jgi:hypothetical protein